MPRGASHASTRLLLAVAVCIGALWLTGGTALAHAPPELHIAIAPDAPDAGVRRDAEDGADCHPDPACHGGKATLAEPAGPEIVRAARRVAPPAAGARPGLAPAKDPPIPIPSL